MDGLLALALVLAAVPAVTGLANLLLVAAPQGRVPDGAIVSILVRARDAEATIEACIAHALGQIGVPVEVIVLDDGSLDHTGELLAALVVRERRVRLLAGSPPPRGWTRHAFAWAQLAEAARGTHFLFLDAAVRLGPHAAAALVGHVARQTAGMVSGVPRQDIGSLGAALAVPLRGVLAAGYPPGGGCAASRLPALATACADLTLMSRPAYDQAGGHVAVRGTRRDMPALARIMRQRGLRTDMVDATRLARCQARCGLRDAWAAMTRMPGGPALLLSGAHLLPIILLPAPRAVLALLLVAALRVGVAVKARDPWWAMLLHPFAMLMLATSQAVALARALLSWTGVRLHPARPLAGAAES